MNSKIETALRELIDDKHPLGPTNAQRLTNPDIAKFFFDADNKIYKAFVADPSIIVGRRGSGKTSFLRSEYLEDDSKIILEFRTASAFAKVLQTLEPLAQGGAILAESVADLWQTVFYMIVFDSLSKTPGLKANLPIVNDYLAKIGIRRAKDLDSMLWNVVDAVARKGGDKTIGVLAEVVKVLDDVSQDDAVEELKAALKARKQRVIILLDSLDGLPLDARNVPHTVSGLIKAVARLDNAHSPVHVRICLPAELYHVFLELSSNPLKDFEDHVTLHWLSQELLSVACHRIQLYAKLYDPISYLAISTLEPDRKRDAVKIFYSLFPEKVVNKMGMEEDTLGYILRHTQLLPRQFLWYLNRIVSAHLRHYALSDKVKSSLIIDTISNLESELVAEVFSAYKVLYPCAQGICERIIPELPVKFDFSTLHKMYNWFGKSVMQPGADVFTFRKLLIEIGAIGKFVRETDRYLEAEFEYTSPHRLITSNADSYCLHPIFAGAYSCKIPSDRNKFKPVFPFGSDIDTNEYRLFGNR